eukprot:201462-Pelagomonas_calceolata.AAC.1
MQRIEHQHFVGTKTHTQAQVLLQAGARERVVGAASTVPYPSQARAPGTSPAAPFSTAPPSSITPQGTTVSEFEVAQATRGVEESNNEGLTLLSSPQRSVAAAPSVGFGRGRGRGLTVPSQGGPANPGSC